MRWLPRIRRRTKKVVIIAHNGATGIMTPTIAAPEVIQTMQRAFMPLVVNGTVLPTLTELRNYVRLQHGLAPVERVQAGEAIEVTNLNGVTLFNYLSRAGFEPILVNDLAYDEDVLDQALEGDVLAVVISTTFLPFKEHLSAVATKVRARRRDVFIVAGGPMIYISHVLAGERPPSYDEEMLRQIYMLFDHDPGVDFMVVDRNGLASLAALLDALRMRKSVEGVPNLAVSSSDGFRYTRICPETPSFEDETIDWDLLPDSAIKRTVAVRGSIGCPFKCKFCNFHFFAPQMLTKPLEQLIRELDQLAGRGQVKRVSLVDDSMLLTRNKVREFCQTLINRDYPFRWTSFVRVDSLAGENVDLVARSGGHLINIGVESGDNGVLKNMDKKLDRDQTLEVISALGERGVSTSSTILVGFPGETHQSVGRTIQLLNDYHSANGAIHWYYPFVFMMLPKIRIEAECERFGLKGFMMKWRHDTMDVSAAARQLRRIALEVEGACLPYSSEHPLAAEVLNLDPVDAVLLVQLVSRHVRNQILLQDGANPEVEVRNRKIFAEIEALFPSTL